MPALVTAFALMAATPFFPFSFRFSLRTLLIATDAGSRGAGIDRRHVKVASGLSDHVWTIKE